VIDCHPPPAHHARVSQLQLADSSWAPMLSPSHMLVARLRLGLRSHLSPCGLCPQPPGRSTIASMRQYVLADKRTIKTAVTTWKFEAICGIVYRSTANRRPGAPRSGWPGGCPTAPPMACPRHVAPPHPAALAHVSRGASRFSGAGPARGGAHVGKAVPCGLGGPREAVSGCLRVWT
jgi:hypothetical protein